jgi:hypothetical protein
MFKYLLAVAASVMMFVSPAKSHGMSDREAAAIALGLAAVLGGVAIASQRKKKPRVYHHYYQPPPRYYGLPPPLHYRYTEPQDYVPYPYYRQRY